MKGGASNTDLSVGGSTNAIIQAGLFRNSVGGSGGASIAVSDLNDLADVNITSPSNGQALIYSSGNWINGTPISASNAATASSADDFTVRGTLTAQTIVAQTVSSSIVYSSGSNRFGNNLTNTQTFTGSVGITGSLSVNNNLLVTGSVTAAGAIARSTYINPTLVASANNDVLVGLDIAPTFTTGAFTGVVNYALRVTGNAIFSNTIYSNSVRGLNTDITISVSNTSNSIFLQGGSTSYLKLIGSNGNLILQNGGTFTDAGYRLDVSGSTRLNGPTTIVSASLDYQQNLAVATGSFQTIVSAATGSFRSAFFDYVTYSASVVRAGTLVSTWSGSVTEYFENFTGDLGGSTAVVTLQTAISASNIVLQAGISGSAWSVRSLVRLL
jgi:hypothetical protein